MRKPQEILQLVPKQPDWRIDWSAAEQSALAPYIDSMRKTQQNPVWHGEGDVWIHTRMVCEELAKQAIMCGGKEDTGGKKSRCL